MRLNIKKRIEEYYSAKIENYTPEQKELFNRMSEIISQRSAYAFGFSAGAYFIGIWGLPWAIGFFVVFVLGSALTLKKIDSVIEVVCSLYLSVFFLSWFFDGNMKKTIALPLALLCYLYAKRSCPALMQSIFEFFESNLLGRALSKSIIKEGNSKINERGKKKDATNPRAIAKHGPLRKHKGRNKIKPRAFRHNNIRNA